MTVHEEHFVIIMLSIIEISKCILIRNMKVFVFVYVILVTSLSIIFYYVRLPPSGLSNTNNILNIYFMKYPMYYAVALLLPFVFCVHFSLSGGSITGVVVPVARILLNWWIAFLVRLLFKVFSQMIGTCDEYPQYNDKYLECLMQGATWTGFEISGHCYYITYATFVIMEEVTVFKKWERIYHLLAVNELTALYCRDPMRIEGVQLSTKVQKRLVFVIKILFVLLAILTILLHLSNIDTIVYFHAIYHKVVAALVVLVIWICTYFSVYRLYFPRTEIKGVQYGSWTDYSSIETHSSS